MIKEPRRLISSLSNPLAFNTEVERSEFEHTNSARNSDRWAGENFLGFIS